ncbi:hypothetical protein [Streptomyces halobius]|uniref:Uncharacterized protein n=1 Tax=Streptomyces halobius TaxID=2879846 RepID=A0ABY4M5A0_9ACTN|nr:hypothetical protein [Streptomyces halobius]UQA92448.1 hypothetical protein K9S39_11910 [Streptomyces halobius]
MPEDVRAVLNSGITLGSLTAILLNLFFNVIARRKSMEIDWDEIEDSDPTDPHLGTATELRGTDRQCPCEAKAQGRRPEDARVLLPGVGLLWISVIKLLMGTGG